MNKTKRNLNYCKRKKPAIYMKNIILIKKLNTLLILCRVKCLKSSIVCLYLIILTIISILIFLAKEFKLSRKILYSGMILKIKLDSSLNVLTCYKASKLLLILILVLAEFLKNWFKSFLKMKSRKLQFMYTQ